MNEQTATTETPPAEKPADNSFPFPVSGEQVAIPRKTGVMIATPLREWRGPEDLPPQVGRMIRELAGRPDAQEYRWEFAAAVGGLCRARNNCVHEFLKSDNTWLYWRDKDLHDQAGADADHLLRLLAHRQPVIGGTYCKRAKRPTWVATWMPAARMQENLPGVVQVAELGGGGKLYHRRVFTELRRIFGEEPLKTPGASSILYRERETGEMIAGFYQDLVLEQDLLSEDYFLDYLCRCAKIPILADTVARLVHVGGDGTHYPEGGAWPPVPAEDQA